MSERQQPQRRTILAIVDRALRVVDRNNEGDEDPFMEDAVPAAPGQIHLFEIQAIPDPDDRVIAALFNRQLENHDINMDRVRALRGQVDINQCTLTGGPSVSIDAVRDRLVAAGYRMEIAQVALDAVPNEIHPNSLTIRFNGGHRIETFSSLNIAEVERRALQIANILDPPEGDDTD